MSPTLEITEDQARAFRMRRHHLLGPGADSPEAAARAVVGIQAQVEAPALWNLALRTAGRPSAKSLKERLFSGTSLVRTWGQRDTVHIYAAAAHWAPMVALLADAPIGARDGLELTPDALAQARERIAALGRPVQRSDLFDLIPADFLAEMATRTGPGMAAQRGAAGRFVWTLSRLGELCIHDTVGREQSYALRRLAYADLPWALPTQDAALRVMVRDWLAANAPATAQDLAHSLGQRMGPIRQALALLKGELASVRCGDRKGLLCLHSDEDALQSPIPTEVQPRLLGKFDTLLMSHKDKSWTVPVEAERPEVWAKAADVRATVLHRGQVVAWWTQKATKRLLTVQIQPLSGWVPGLERALAPDLDALAAHLDLPEGRISVG